MLRDPALIPLSHQHQHALALCLLTDRALAADQSDGNLGEQARQIVRQFESEMKRHFAVEEEVLFPALADFPGVRDLVAELIAEHRSMTALVEILRRASDRKIILEFTVTLRQHVRKEEGYLFEQAQRLLSREQLDQMAGKLAAV